ncbi:hypothetical protein OH77DRAFT_1042478 [Trametes cingulata]|nr:hypothetical protein OH77DRAFT_1042478 [Trametes cingulata]
MVFGPVKSHQVFLITHVKSKDNTTAYRCIGVFRDDNSIVSESLPLVAMRRFFSLLLQEENAAVVLEELRDLDGKFYHPSAATPAPDACPAVPCPYTISLLSIAWTFSKVPSSIRYNLPFDIAVDDARTNCWECTNDLGLTVIDITNPKRPSYCFLFDPATPPLSAYEYLAKRCDLANVTGSAMDRLKAEGVFHAQFSDDLLDHAWWFLHLSEVSGHPLIPASALCEAWPGLTFGERLESSQITCVQGWIYSPTVFVILRHIRLTESGSTCASDPPAEWEVSRAESLLGVIFQLVGRPESVDARVRDRCARLLTALLAHPSLFDFVLVSLPSIAAPQRSTVEAVLERYLAPSPALHDWLYASTRGTHYVSILEVTSRLRTIPSGAFLDLSGLDICATDVVRFVSTLPQVRSLSLARNPQLTIRDIPWLTMALPGVRRLNLMGCPGIDDGDIRGMVLVFPLIFCNLEGIWHRAFLGINKPPEYPTTFTFMRADTELINGVTLPFFTPAQVMQAIINVLPPMLREHPMSELPSPCDQLESAGGYVDIAMLDRMAFNALSTAADPLPTPWWSAQVVVAVPGHPYPLVSPLPEGTWAFCLDWVPSRRKMKYGFIRYLPSPDSVPPSSRSQAESQSDRPGRPLWAQRGHSSFSARHNLGGHVPLRRGELLSLSAEVGIIPPESAVYGLREFLRCMANEGRPLPPVALVEEFEAMLNTSTQWTLDYSQAPQTLEPQESPIAFMPATLSDASSIFNPILALLPAGAVPVALQNGTQLEAIYSMIMRRYLKLVMMPSQESAPDPETELKYSDTFDSRPWTLESDLRFQMLRPLPLQGFFARALRL